MTLSKKDQLAYWSSEAFLNQYFQSLEFDKPYAKAYGTIALGWVTNPWRQHIRQITFKFVKIYVKKHHRLPEGEHIFNVNWDVRNAKWLNRVLLKEQIVIFPKIEEA
jgi:hypothetical protein